MANKERCGNREHVNRRKKAQGALGAKFLILGRQYEEHAWQKKT
jgi:hypothetical protein